jgi:hypothetical protein
MTEPNEDDRRQALDWSRAKGSWPPTRFHGGKITEAFTHGEVEGYALGLAVNRIRAENAEQRVRELEARIGAMRG